MVLSIMILFIGDRDGDDANLLWLNVWWNHVLNSFWQMCALSAWASYLRWQTVWCHPGASLSNNNLWEFSSSPIFSKLLACLLGRASHIQQNPGSNKGLRMQCTDRRFKTGFCHGRRRKRRKRRRHNVDQNLKQRKRKLSKKTREGICREKQSLVTSGSPR